MLKLHLPWTLSEKKKFHMVTGADTNASVRVSCLTIGSLFFSGCLGVQTSQRTVESLPEWSNMALSYSAPCRSQPIKRQYQYQQDSLGYIRNDGMVWVPKLVYKSKERAEVFSEIRITFLYVWHKRVYLVNIYKCTPRSTDIKMQ